MYIRAPVRAPIPQVQEKLVEDYSQYGMELSTFIFPVQYHNIAKYMCGWMKWQKNHLPIFVHFMIVKYSVVKTFHVLQGLGVEEGLEDLYLMDLEILKQKWVSSKHLL